MDLFDRIKFSSAVFDNNPETQKLFKSGQLKFASDIARPAPKQGVIEIDAINSFVKRNPRADGGRIGFKKGSSEKFLVKVGSPKKLGNVIEQEFIEVIGSKNRPETYKKTGVKKTLYKPQIVVKNKTVLTSDFGSKDAAIAAVKKYREKNPIKNAPPDLETLDKRKKKKYLDKKERQSDIKARGGVPEGGIFSGNPEVHKGHAGNIKGSQTITGDKIIYTPAKINQAMAGTEGENRFTDLDYKINEAEKKINKIKKSNNSNVEKKKLLKIEDNKLIKYASQSDGYKVVKLSDGSEFRLPGKSLQSLDPFDAFPGMSEKDISKTVNKYKNMKVTKNTSPKDIEMIKKVGVFLENAKLAKSNVPKKELLDFGKNNIQKLAAIGCPGKAMGGRIGFFEGQNLNACAAKGLQKLKTTDITKFTPGDKANVKAITKTVQGGRLLKNILGPGALAFEGLFALPFAAYDFSKGRSGEDTFKNAITLGFIDEKLKENELKKIFPEYGKGADLENIGDRLTALQRLQKGTRGQKLRSKPKFEKAEQEFKNALKPFLETGDPTTAYFDNLKQSQEAEQELENQYKDVREERGVGEFAEPFDFSYGEFNSLANGGIAGLSGGDKSGAAPESGPQPQGLPYVYNRVKRT